MSQSIFIQTLIYLTLSLFLLICAVKIGLRIKTKSSAVSFAIGLSATLVWFVFSLSLSFATTPLHGEFCKTGMQVALFGTITGSLYNAIKNRQVKWLILSFVFGMAFYQNGSILSFIMVCAGGFIWILFEKMNQTDEDWHYSVEQLMDILEDEVIVLDRNENIMAVSGTLKKMAMTQRLPETYQGLLQFMKWREDESCGQNEGFVEMGGEPYRVMIIRQKLENDVNEQIGEVVICHDITTYHHLKEKLNLESQKLAQANRELVDYIAVQNELAVEETKRKFAEEIQNSIGVAIHILMEKLETVRTGDQNEALDVLMIEEMIESGRRIIHDIRGTATLLMGHDQTEEGVRIRD